MCIRDSVAAVIASEQGIDYVSKNMPRQATTIWAAAVDEEDVYKRQVRNELAKKFSNQMPSSRNRRILGMTGRPSTSASMLSLIHI